MCILETSNAVFRSDNSIRKSDLCRFWLVLQGCGSSVLLMFFQNTEKPAELCSAGLLRLDTNISRRYYIYFFGAKHLGIRFVDYSMIVATLPEPTVLPPSRIAKRRPCSIATGWISSIVISTLSPGMHISVPSGSSQTPVTSVVLK